MSSIVSVVLNGQKPLKYVQNIQHDGTRLSFLQDLDYLVSLALRNGLVASSSKDTEAARTLHSQD